MEALNILLCHGGALLCHEGLNILLSHRDAEHLA